jgi:hypothetical protein
VSEFRFAPPTRDLAKGLIFEIARAGGIEVPNAGEKRVIRCPFHDDRHPSAFLTASNVFCCSRCTPEKGLSAKRFAAAIGQPWNGRKIAPAPLVRKRDVDPAPAFTAQAAQLVYSRAFARARDDEFAAADREVYAYLSERGILESWELVAFGVLAEDMALPKAIAWWPRAGYRVVVPLYDARGELVSIQARAIVPPEKKTVFPTGSSAKGTAFASARAIELLRSGESSHDIVLLGEGLTDFLALVSATSIPVFCAPGTGFAVGCIGSWVRGRTLLVALDMDEAGSTALQPVASAAYNAGARRVMRVEWPPNCKDACDVVQLRLLAGLEALLAKYVEAARG